MVGKIVFFGFFTIFALVVVVCCVYCEMPLMSAVSGILLGIFSICLVAFLWGGNEPFYNYAVIKLSDGSIVKGELDSYDYSDDRVEVIIDGIPYEVGSGNCTFFVK